MRPRTPTVSNANRATRSRFPATVLAALAALAALALMALAVGCGSDSKTTTTQQAGQGEVFLEPKGDAGPDPFTASVAGKTPAPKRKDGSASAQTSTSEGEGNAVHSESGTTPGLYGGTQDQRACDRKQLIEFLEANADKRRAWTGALGISEGDVRSYVMSLAPVVLTSDTRVTNHGFANGLATARQSVLEAGTAVLVDDRGIPRVRCACGNPLLEPTPVSVGPTYVGAKWPGFSPAVIIVIAPSPPVTKLIVIDLEGGKDFEVPVGPPKPPPTGTDETPTTTTDEGSGTSGSYESCARRYGELVRDLAVAGIHPSQASQWAADAKEAAVRARGGDLPGAKEIICGTVREMEDVLRG